MPAKLAIMPTGNAWISTNLPGFTIMRASYRWSALGSFALWLLVILWVSRTNHKGRILWGLGLLGVIALNLPHLPGHWRAKRVARALPQQIDAALVTELRRQIRPQEVVAFHPWGNDFIANYLAPRAGFRTFNIGGDKNAQEAYSHWPSSMREIRGYSAAVTASSMLKLLAYGDAAVIVIPYFDMLRATKNWLQAERAAPGEKASRAAFVEALRASSYFEVVDSALFATVRLRPEFAGAANRGALIAALLGKVSYPIVIGDQLQGARFILNEGWNELEAQMVWSQAEARITLPVPESCAATPSIAKLTFIVFGASPSRPVLVRVGTLNFGVPWHEAITASGDGNYSVAVPLSNPGGTQDITISIPAATSPLALKYSLDGRVLGMGLQRIDLLAK